MWHSFIYFFSLVYNVHELGRNKLYMAFHWWSGDLWRESLKCGKEKTGCMMSMFAIPTPLALRIALQPLFFFSFPPLFSLMELTWNLLYVKENNNTSLLKYLFLNPSKNTSNGEKEVNLFWFCLILLLFLMLIPHSLF